MEIMVKTATVFLALIISFQAQAQLKGTHILGDAGLKSGSQAPPSLSTAIPLYFYKTTSLRNDNGDKVDPEPDLNMFITGVALGWVSNIKILGANYGNSILVGFAKNKIEGNNLNVNGSLAFTDMYVQPVQLGWTTSRADYVFSYSLYLPTGKWEKGGDDNSGLGMLSNEFAAGITLYLDKLKKNHFSALFSYAINGEKEDSGIKTGDLLSIEGGLGRSFYKMAPDSKMPAAIFSGGLTYYMQFKMREDKIPIGSSVFTGNKDRGYALGTEANLTLPRAGLVVGARWLAELGSRNRFQGQTLFITAAYVIGTEPIERK